MSWNVAQEPSPEAIDRRSRWDKAKIEAAHVALGSTPIHEMSLRYRITVVALPPAAGAMPLVIDFIYVFRASAPVLP
ncbi:hypothetical protein CHELA20_51931 [Hyphomicrobiales bacterium]|nr:hypothetical protein CHELA41_22997 [Hyphomicrobiales bacterium]CAH1679515.1 hypothetical protein CHELA20_51931 [Hyphomicrobiales bacterium]